MATGWANSNRRAELPPDWAKRRQQVKRRVGGRCQAEQHEPDCDGIGTDCDHIGDRHDHSLGNLQWLSGPCHAAKTKREAAARRPAVLKPRPRRRHPSEGGGVALPPGRGVHRSA